MVEFIHPGPDSPEELIETLAEAESNDVIGADSRVMLERVIRMADRTAGDVMVAAPRMDVVNIDAPYDDLLRPSSPPRIRAFRCTRASARTSSAFCWPGPAQLQRSPPLNIRALLRPAVFCAGKPRPA